MFILKKGIGIRFKQGAMFGLDARIALAIFGALSVISGAALYSAIEKSKVISLLTELEEVGKAYQAYLLDTGQDLPIVGQYYTSDELLSSTVNGWKGPYLSYDMGTPNDGSFLHPVYNKMGVWRFSSGGTTTGNSSEYLDCTATVCDLYVYVNGVNESIAKALDIYVDGSSGYNSGRVILGSGYTGAGDVFNVAVSYKYMPVIKN